MLFLDRILMLTGFVCVCIPVLAGPWLFGAWEMWWFWPLMMSIFMATLSLAVRLILAARRPRDTDRDHDGPGRAFYCLASFVPFLLYALIRALTTEVFMDAERTFLLFLGPFLIGILVVFGLNRPLLTLLYILVIVNLALLGLYGVINHVATGSSHVLWLPGYPQYTAEVRATGS